MYQYHTSLPPIPLKAYGRHITHIVDMVVKTPDRALRNEQAQALVQLMKQVKKSANARPEDDARLWANLFVISDYQLDVDAPYPMPQKEDKKTSPPSMNYKSPIPYHKCCGKYLTQFICKTGKKLGKNEAEDEEILLELFKCIPLLHKKGENTNLLPHIERVMGKKIKVTPSLEDFLNRKSIKRKKNYSPFRNGKKY